MSQRMVRQQAEPEGRTSFGEYEIEAAKAFLKDAENLGAFEVDSTTQEFLNIWKKPDGAVWIEHEHRGRAIQGFPDEDYLLSLRLAAGASVPDSLVEFDKDVLLADPVVRKESRGALDLQILTSGHLRVVANREFYEDFDPSKKSEDRLHDLLEGHLCNGWACVDSYNMGGGSYAITNDGGTLLSDGEVGYHDHYWYQTDSLTEDPIQALLEKGFVHFSRQETKNDLDEETIRDWKQRTNDDYRESQGDPTLGDLWPLDEPKAQEGLRSAAVKPEAPLPEYLPGVSISPDIGKLEAPRHGCAIFEVVTADGTRLRGSIQGSGGRLGAGVAHSKKPGLIARNAAETLEACIHLASEGKPLEGAFLSVYEPLPGHVELTVLGHAGPGGWTVNVPLAGTSFKVIDV